jgi:hypothetical protein
MKTILKKTQWFTVITTLCLVLVTLYATNGCIKSENIHKTDNNDIEKLQGTKWKLIGIFDTQTGDLQELEPKDCEGCYTILFDTDSTFSGQMVVNILFGKYGIDYKTDDLLFSDVVATEMCCAWNAEESLYHQILWKIQSFIIKRQIQKSCTYIIMMAKVIYSSNQLNTNPNPKSLCKKPLGS